jgi:DNA-binding transcriptional ArsR family regulator
MIDKYLIEYLISATRGGMTRLKIIRALKKQAMNINKISSMLKFDYKTVQHHLKVLEENRIIEATKKGSYGALYHLTRDMEEQWELIEEIIQDLV